MEQAQNSEEILILDENGQFKILKDGNLVDYHDIVPDKQVKIPVIIPKKASVSSNLPIDTGMEEKMLQPPPPVVRNSGSAFYFHPLDEEEVARYVNLSKAGPQKKYSLGKIVKKIEENYKLSLSAGQKTKLSKVIFSFLRDRRDAIAAKQVLTAPAAKMDFGIDSNIAVNLLEFLQEIKTKINTEGGLVVEEEFIENDSKQQAQLSQIKQEPIKPIVESKPIPHVSEQKAAEKIVPIKQEFPDLDELKRITLEAGKQIQPEPIKVLPDVPVSGGLNKRFSRPVKLPANQMTDVKKGIKLYGPVEELATLGLENWRMLGNTPIDRTAKIMGKINVLSKDSLVRRSAGIKAWKQSPLYKMYLAIGHSSMENNLDVKKIIEEYIKQGRDIISAEEFDAISDFNRQLRF